MRSVTLLMVMVVIFDVHSLCRKLRLWKEVRTIYVEIHAVYATSNPSGIRLDLHASAGIFFALYASAMTRKQASLDLRKSRAPHAKYTSHTRYLIDHDNP